MKILLILPIMMLSMGLMLIDAKADVTGNFETHVSIIPQTTVSEFSLINFDVQNALNVNFIVSGLTTQLHSHFGIAGIEDIILTVSTTLGALDIESEIILGRFPFGSITPFYPSVHFIQKRMDAQISIGGVTFATSAQFDDTAAFVSQTPAYAFGSAISLAGETQSGVNIFTQIGICMEQNNTNIKKHFQLSPFSVNPDCATTPKPDVLFDFEIVQIRGIPLAPGVLGGGELNCLTFNVCSLDTTVSISGGAVPFQTTLVFSDLLNLTLGVSNITLFSGPATLVIELMPTGVIGSMTLTMAATLNPDTNPASFALTSSFTPGVGITSVMATMLIERAGLVVGSTVVMGGGPPASFQAVQFSFNTSLGIFNIETSATFTPTGLASSDLWFTINF
jgi:hypothetical protein